MLFISNLFIVLPLRIYYDREDYWLWSETTLWTYTYEYTNQCSEASSPHNVIDVVIYIDGRKRQAGKKTLSGSSFFLLLDYSEIDEILRLQYSIQVVLVSYPESVIQGVIFRCRPL